MKPPQLLDTHLAHIAALLFLTVPSSVPITPVSRHIKDLHERRWNSLGLLFAAFPFCHKSCLSSYNSQTPFAKIVSGKERESNRWLWGNFGTLAVILVFLFHLLSIPSPPLSAHPPTSQLPVKKQQADWCWHVERRDCQPTNELIIEVLYNEPWIDCKCICHCINTVWRK